MNYKNIMRRLKRLFKKFKKNTEKIICYVVIFTFSFQALGGNVFASTLSKSNNLISNNNLSANLEAKASATQWSDVITELEEVITTQAKIRAIKVDKLKELHKKFSQLDKQLRKEFEETKNF
jgi:uncharacterized coiled-coil protein SlyX